MELRLGCGSNHGMGVGVIGEPGDIATSAREDGETTTGSTYIIDIDNKRAHVVGHRYRHSSGRVCNWRRIDYLSADMDRCAY